MEDNKLISQTKYWYEKFRTFYFSMIGNIFSPENFPNKNPQLYKKIGFFAVLIFIIIFKISVVAPKNFPIGDVATIYSGDSLKVIGDKLQAENVIKSEFIFRTVVIILGGERKIIAGDYLLDKRENAITIANRLVKGAFHLEAVKVTIPEGWNVFKMSDYLSSKLVKFDKSEFLKLAMKEEGYLFPDTYFVSATIKPGEIIKMMRDNFDQKISTINEIKTFLKPLKDVVIMASILEGEALPQDRRIVAGILWRRISLGMPLQVDSTFKYINGKDSYNLTLDDLKINSPYNTYLYKGLPPGPISNPGIDAIISAVTPITTKYLYFLTEKDGTIHYAKTFEEHKKNRELYLK